MISFIARIMKALFIIFFFLMFTPTLWFLTKNYYAHMVAKKSYIGFLELPSNIEKSSDIIDSMKSLFYSPEIKAIVLKCDGNGGNQGACAALIQDLLELQKLYKKIIIGYVENNCSGGSFLIFQACNLSVCTPYTQFSKLGNFDMCNGINDTYFKYLETLKPQHKKEIQGLLANTTQKEIICGNYMYEHNLVNALGGSLAIEKLIRSNIIIEGKIEEVHGSLLEHFVSYVTDLVVRIIKIFQSNMNRPNR
jgi:hypothetical protein